uniref:Uncharacterized protein n=1 Tax=Caenorhabditis japonica TaxID=281687 RepID=A0A8R1DV84_CAEJA
MENCQLYSLFLLLLLSTITVSAGLIQSRDISVRVKRQWGPMPWQQRQWNNQRNANRISAQQQQYNCQTQGINLIGLPISSYSCQNSGMSAKVNTLQQSQQANGFMQGPIGGFLNNFMGRRK